MNQNRILIAAASLILVCGFLFIIAILLPGLGRMATQPATPEPDLLSTLTALTPGSTEAVALPTTTFIASSEPTGRIVYTCQLFKVQASNQICIINADGTGFRRLTTDDGRQHLYASPSPDVQSVVYAAFREANVYEIYELSLIDGAVRRLTDRLGVLGAPEISPDGQAIVFTYGSGTTDAHAIWLMNRDGGNPHPLISGEGWDPTWSPDGRQILFASDRGGSNQLWIGELDGSNPVQVSNLPALRGRSDWSPQNLIVTYSGEPWQRELYMMNVDGSNPRLISPGGGNAQGPSFSPDGQWLAFTAYYDRFNDIHGCEIYILRADGSDLRRLTDNDYCDYQPRWGS